jgi:uncharacterized lipoprotein YddW (UPF0748 family)
MKAASLVLCLIMIPAILPDAYAQEPPKREFRAAWVASVTNLDWPSTAGGDPQVQREQMVTLFDKLKATGISVIIFQVRPECDALYHSSIEPWSYWLTGVQGSAPSPFYDPLEFAVDEAHKRGMELHAWFNPYRAERVVGGYPTAANHVTQAHPDWVIQIGTLKFLNPGLAQVREHDARVIADVVRRYDVDGIHMDDYFYPYPPNQITNQDAATFAADPRGFANIGDWRRDNVNLLLRMIRDSLQAIKPFVKFGMSPFGIWRHYYPPSVGGGTLSAYDDIYCDAIAWLQQNTIDYLTPQLYWAIGSGTTDYSQLVSWWGDSVSANSRHFYPGQAAYRISGWAASEMPNQIRMNRANPKVEGSVFFRANQGITDNPKGFADSLKTNYYRYPALHPVMAWKDAVPPYPPRGIRYARLPGDGPWALQWDLPNTAPDGDSANRYAVYRFDHRPTLAEFGDARNLLSVEGRRWVLPPPPGGSTPVYYSVTALDRNYNESDTSNILLIGPPTAPLLASPANGATSLPESVLVRWRHTDQTAQYHLQVSTDPAFATSLLVNDSSITDTSRIVNGLAGLSTYAWRVRAGNAAGFGAFAIAYSFSTGFPPVPNLLAPPNQTPDVPVTPTFRWNAASAATSYRIQIAKGADFASIFADSSGLTDTTVAVGPLEYYRIYFWRVRATNGIGTSGWSSVNSFRTAQVVAVERDEALPKEYSLSQNYPNPFNPTTTIQFTVPQNGRVSVKVYDVLGREEATLVDEEMPAGAYRVTWNAATAASGVYFYRIVAGSFTATKRMVLVR